MCGFKECCLRFIASNMKKMGLLAVFVLLSNKLCSTSDDSKIGTCRACRVRAQRHYQLGWRWCGAFQVLSCILCGIFLW